MNNQTSTPQNSRSNLPGWDLKDLYSGIDDPQIKKDLEEYRRLNQKLAITTREKLLTFYQPISMRRCRLKSRAALSAVSWAFMLI